MKTSVLRETKCRENRFEGAGFLVFKTGLSHKICVTVTITLLKKFLFGVGKPEVTEK
jgi:hypothetical protein